METALPTMRVPEMNAYLAFQVFGARPTALPSDLAYTDRANTFTVGPQTILTGDDATRGLVVKGNSTSQSAAPLEVQNSAGFVTFGVKPSYSAYDNNGGAMRVANSVDGKSYFGDNNGLAFRIASGTNGWADSVSSTFFEAGDGNLVFESVVGFIGNRLQFSFASTQVTDYYYNQLRAPTANFEVHSRTADTNAVGVMAQLNRESSGTPAAGFGAAYAVRLHSSTTKDRLAARIDVSWSTATDATRKGRLSFSVYDTAAREALRLDTDGSNPFLTMFGPPSAPWGSGFVLGERFGAGSGNAAGTGALNTALGAGTLTAVTSGGANTAVGNTAGNTLTTGGNNTLLGASAQAAANNTNGGIALGASAVCASNEFALSYLVNVVTLYGQSDTPQTRPRADFTVSWVDSTDASRKAKIAFHAWDTAAREFMVAEADGTNPRLYQCAPPSAPTDSHIPTSEVSFYLDEGGNNLKVRVRYSDGTTLKTGTIALV